MASLIVSYKESDVLLAVLVMPEDVYKNMWKHLLPKKMKYEQAAFLFVNASQSAGEIKLEYREWYAIPPRGFLIQSAGHIELNDETRATVIKKAHDLQACLVEFHSHLYSYEVGFSWSDISGFKEFVPHVMWRLKGRPYAAVVVGKTGFDALIWSKAANLPELLSEIHVGKRILRPTGATLRGGFE
ncbi:conserved hypothetical protein [Candidatus Nitrosotenuis uzonensis]|uniref:JAB domain-containing protein n=1 Tax=Candidatus Nitrosotenuis uzonensis TaxID=1407055 RepID=A0A812EY86_9ARCH|nr:conserved hypothetical protein [Candidatus Nitrosotenuis uzonensis]